jgi:hypothetical protein
LIIKVYLLLKVDWNSEIKENGDLYVPQILIIMLLELYVENLNILTDLKKMEKEMVLMFVIPIKEKIFVELNHQEFTTWL